MTRSSDRLHRPIPDADAPGAAPVGGNSHARFIPREELRHFAAWTPGNFGSGTAPVRGVQPPVPEPPAPPNSEQIQAQQLAARQAGYQDGYRDGLVALEGFKQSYAAQVTAQIDAVSKSYAARLEALELQLAERVADVAIVLARQVVRSELATRPELVAAVAQETLTATLASAKQLALHLHPDDHALVQAHVGATLAERGVRLMPDAGLARGGCVLDTEVGVIDASLEARWRRAVAAMGRDSDWAPLDEARA
jgi:flagellar assembly protein FliH